MDNIINLKFDNNPDPGDYIEFMYDTSGDGDYETIRFIFVPSGNRLMAGEFDIQQTVGETIEAFNEYFINDFQLKVNGIDLFNVKVDQEIIVRIENILGGFSGLVVSSPSSNIDGELTSNIDEGVNELTFIINEQVSDGDTISFNYYSNYPDKDITENIVIEFVSGTPSNIGEVEIGSDINETYSNLLNYFSRYYNTTGQFDIYLEEDDNGDHNYITIKASNSSTLTQVESTIDKTILDIEKSNTTIVLRSASSDIILSKSPKMVYNTSSLNYKRFRFSMKLLSNPTPGSSFVFYIKQNDIGIIFYEKTFVVAAVESNEIDIGVDVNDTMINLFNNLLTYNESVIEYSLLNNIIYLDIYDGEYNEYSLDLISNDSNIEFYGPVVDGGSRGYDHTIFIVSQWEGVRMRLIQFDDLTENWIINKQLISDRQVQTYINVSPLIQNTLRSNISNYISQSLVLPLAPNTSKWVSVSARNRLVNVDRDYISRTFFTLDGWSEDGISDLPRVLLSGGSYIVEYEKPVKIIRRSLHRNSTARIFYQTTRHDGMIDVFGKHSSRTIVNTGGNPSINTEYVKSVKVPFTDYLDQPFVQTITMVFGYSKERFPSGNRPIDDSERPIEDLTLETTKVIIDIVDECKYPVVEVIFKNRYGVLETITFGKVSKRDLKTTRGKYKYSVVDINGTPNLNSHNERPYDINGQEEYTLNTGFVKEYMNDVYTDLFMSDEIFLKCENTNKFVPVLLMDNDFQRMKRVNDGLINYTFRFKTSYNKNYNFS